MSERPNIILKQLEFEDADSLFSLVDRNRPQLKKFWWEAQTQTALDSLKFIEAARTDEQYSRRPSRGIWHDDRLIGIGSIHSVDWDLGRAALGYWIDKDEWGKGFATETARQLSQLAFGQLGLKVLTISCRASNTASRAVAEKVGFQLTGIDTHASWRSSSSGATEIAHYELIKTA